MAEITVVMDFGGLARDEGAEPGIPDPQHSPESCLRISKRKKAILCFVPFR
jgi:hypothetical protein